MEKHNRRKKYNILISVNESILCLQRDSDEKPFSVKEAIEREFGWLHESGIYLEEILISTRKT